MQPFDLRVLLLPGLVIFFATFWVAQRVTRSFAFSLPAALIKAGAFWLYFGLLFDGTYTFLDDWSYLEGGRQLYAQGVGITNLAQNWHLLLTVGSGNHFLYYLYNAYAFQLFGETYFAPVALNVLLTSLIAWFGTNLAGQEFGLGGPQRKYFFVFLLLHPDILVWSNIMNGKDIFVLLMHVLLLLSCSFLFRRRWVAALVLAVPVSLVLFFMRFYVPLLFVVALAASQLFVLHGKGRLRLFVLSGVLGALVLSWLGPNTIQYARATLADQVGNPFYGFVRFLLTPIPFNTDEAYRFLDFPMLIHWLLLPFACWGVVMAYRLSTPFSRFFLLYMLIFVGLYAVFVAEQGPRARVQLDYAWAVLQFMGLMAFFRFPLVGTERVRVYLQPRGDSDLTNA